MKNKKSTMKDVAELAGVSISSISHAVSAFPAYLSSIASTSDNLAILL